MISRRNLMLSIPAALTLVSAAARAATPEESAGWAGRLDGVRHWRLPNTPNGLKPIQSWHATGSAPDGDIYVGGMDHATNAALYRVARRSGQLRYLGDARAASEAAGNWRPGETAEKFHTRPLWFGGKVYVATLDRSTLDDAYLGRRGFHWYAYDPAQDRFSDLSAGEPGGVGAPHLGLVTLAGDPARNVIYGAAIPTAELFRYDVAQGRTEALGRPASYDRRYLYTNRVMWVDSRGRLYFTAGSPQYEPAADPAIYGHIHYYDAATGGFGERRDWQLAEPRALETGQAIDNGRRRVFADDQGHVYRFDDEGPTWSYLGKMQVPEAELWVWVLQVSADGTKAYYVTSSWMPQANPAMLSEFDLASGESRRLCALDALDPVLGLLFLHTGYDAWDGEGRFYFTSFTSDTDAHVVLTRVDPARLKSALRLSL
ncbi:MAG TPA: hypothetical protein VMU85_07955 [Stellaceae bacterium]|nr:hypothetical protein [Stellaceae bacterium]